MAALASNGSLTAVNDTGGLDAKNSGSIERRRAMTDHDADFYAKREEQERALADRASDPSIARIHLEMAEQYASRARTASNAQRVGEVRPKLHMAARGG
jgi:hypothetical protein